MNDETMKRKIARRHFLITAGASAVADADSLADSLLAADVSVAAAASPDSGDDAQANKLAAKKAPSVMYIKRVKNDDWLLYFTVNLPNVHLSDGYCFTVIFALIIVTLIIVTVIVIG